MLLGTVVGAHAATVEPVPGPCPPLCYGGLVVSSLTGEATYDIPYLAGQQITISVAEYDGWEVAFSSDVPVVRVSVSGGGTEVPCNVFSYETDPLVYSD
jgi:hypothetical protein